MEMQTRSHRPLLWRSIRAGGLIAVLALAGCPGKLENPDKFLDGEGANFECTLGIDVPMFLAERCTGASCHNPDTPAAGLDLASPDVASRLVGVASSSCQGKLLVSPEGAAQSFLFEKLGPSPACGSPMPFGQASLSEDELACVGAWITEVTTGGGGDGGPEIDAATGDAPPAADAMPPGADAMPGGDAMP